MSFLLYEHILILYYCTILYIMHYTIALFLCLDILKQQMNAKKKKKWFFDKAKLLYCIVFVKKIKDNNQKQIQISVSCVLFIYQGWRPCTLVHLLNNSLAATDVVYNEGLTLTTIFDFVYHYFLHSLWAFPVQWSVVPSKATSTGHFDNTEIIIDKSMNQPARTENL